MKKIIVFGLTGNVGGVETFYMSYYRKLNLVKDQIDFVVTGDKIAFEEEIKNAGSTVYKLPDLKRHPLQYTKTLSKILKENKYDVAHINMLSAANILPLKISKKFKIKKIIAHSHNSNIPSGIIRKLLHYFNKNKIQKYANEYLACSELAGKWLFGENIKFIVLNNAVDLDKFRYIEKFRKEIRSKYSIKEKEFVIGHIGRFSEQKNQEFIIEFFNKYLKFNKMAKLILIGSGENQSIIKQKISKLNIDNNVVIVDNTLEVYKYYSAFDLFVLPSKFEGLPVVGIEAQANGLSCLFSDRITKELSINNNLKFLSIDYIDEWVNAIIEMKYNRCNNILLKKKGYSIEENAIQLQKIYQLGE